MCFTKQIPELKLLQDQSESPPASSSLRTHCWVENKTCREHANKRGQPTNHRTGDLNLFPQEFTRFLDNRSSGSNVITRNWVPEFARLLIDGLFDRKLCGTLSQLSERKVYDCEEFNYYGVKLPQIPGGFVSVDNNECFLTESLFLAVLTQSLGQSHLQQS